MTRPLATLFAVGALLTSAAAPAAPACMSPAEAEALIGAVAPALVEGLVQRCRPVLPATSFVARSGQSYAARLTGEIRPDWPRARAAMAKIGGGDELPDFLSDDTLQTMIGPMARDMMLSEFKTKDCATADRLVGLLSPLPAANLVSLFVTLASLGEEKGKLGKFPICRPSAR